MSIPQPIRSFKQYQELHPELKPKPVKQQAKVNPMVKTYVSALTETPKKNPHEASYGDIFLGIVIIVLVFFFLNHYSKKSKLTRKKDETS